MTLRFLQLSDVHFGQEKNGTLPEHDDVRRQLIEDAKAMATRRGRADMILVVGDAAFSGKEHEYRRAGEWLDLLAKAVGCEERSVRLVPGNHDCDRSKVSEVCGMVHEAIRAGTPKSAYRRLERIAQDADKENPVPSPLLPKLEAYRTFASSYQSDFKSAAAPMWSNDFELPVGVTLRLFGLNSVQVCDDKDHAGKMILGNTQYVFNAEPHVIPVVLIHHPTAWLMDKAEAESYLHNRAHVILVGHEHIPRFSKVSTADHERIDISSGATNPPEQGALYKHTYNWLEMTVEVSADGTPLLNVEVFSRAWSYDITRFTADRPRMEDRESIAFELKCRRVQPLRVIPRHDLTLSHPVSSTTATVEEVEKGGANVSTAEADVEQLQFLFWRYLNWQQRLTVLVTADVLPKSAVEPIPQTREKLAINTAREQDKLHAVWDAMLPYLPEAKRQPNPFKKTA